MGATVMTAFKQTASVFLAGSLLFAQITGFGTGSHFDVTRTVLNEHGFSEDGIKMVQVSNWLTDYYATSPTRSDEHRADLEKRKLGGRRDRMGPPWDEIRMTKSQ